MAIRSASTAIDRLISSSIFPHLTPSRQWAQWGILLRPALRWSDLAPGSAVAHRHKERGQLITEHRTEPDVAVLDTDGIGDRVFLQGHGYAQSFKLDRDRATTPHHQPGDEGRPRRRRTAT